MNLETEKQRKIDQVYIDFERFVTELTGGNNLSPSLISSFSTIEAEARKFILSQVEEPTTILYSEATAKGISVSDLANSVVAKADAYKVAVGAMKAKMKTAIVAILSAPDKNTLDGIEIGI